MSKYKITVEGVSVEALFNRIGGVEGARRFLRGELVLVEAPPDLVYVDRTIRPFYPSRMTYVLNPEFEMGGPTEFECVKLELWLHPIQQRGVVKAQVIYDHLRQNDMLLSCLNLRDLEEIQRKGLTHFRKHFKDQTVFGWKSVISDDDNLLYAPFLREFRSQVILDWTWLAHSLYPSNPALRFV